MRQYQLISADGHVQEPPDTWQKRVPGKFRDRAPRVVRTDEGDAWVVEGQVARTLGMEVQAGKKFEDCKAAGETYDTIRKGSSMRTAIGYFFPLRYFSKVPDRKRQGVGIYAPNLSALVNSFQFC